MDPRSEHQTVQSGALSGAAATAQETIEPDVKATFLYNFTRFIEWPGQATAYKVGMQKILDLRARAKAALGARFDIKGFHDTVLGGGAMPLEILELLAQASAVGAVLAVELVAAVGTGLVVVAAHAVLP